MENSSNNLPHLFLLNKRDKETQYKVNRKLPPLNDKASAKEPDEKIESDDIATMKATYKECMAKFDSEKNERHSKRDKTLIIPEHIDYIQIDFYGLFSKEIQKRYRNNFGISPVRFELFNQRILFAILEEDKFKILRYHLEYIINTNISDLFEINPDIKIIKSFEYLTTEKILNIPENPSKVSIEISDLPSEDLNIAKRKIHPIENTLENYLKDNNISYELDKKINILELYNANYDTLKLIIDNFDIINQVNSFRTMIRKPGLYGEAILEYGFTAHAAPDSPIIGIIDTGIDRDNPLGNILIDDTTYDLTSSNSFEDSCDHGTAIACLAALGEDFFNTDKNVFDDVPRILSIKAFDNDNVSTSYFDLTSLIRQANSQYGIKIFVLTMTSIFFKGTNTNVSSYAYLLDKLSYELNILIFISIGNFSEGYRVTYPEHFKEEELNLFPPSESMNNMTIGSIADNFEPRTHLKFSTAHEHFPAIYTRKFYIKVDEETDIKRNNITRHLFKPDVVHCGGDDGVEAGLNILSATKKYLRDYGTSFSAPLVANIASKIISKYPNLNMQSVKALIINSSFNPWGSETIPQLLAEGFGKNIKTLIGHGKPNTTMVLNSMINEVTFIIEDFVEAHKIKAIPLNFPDYLQKLRSDTVLSINATLCYKFEPVFNNHLAYCPYCISFGFFKNLPLENEDDKTNQINYNKTDNYKLQTKTTWSEDYFLGRKLLSNVQKLKFNLKKADLINEDNTLKIAIKCQLHKQLPSDLLDKYNSAHDISLVIRISEKLKKGEKSHNLYREIAAQNIVQAINVVEQEIDLDI